MHADPRTVWIWDHCKGSYFVHFRTGNDREYFLTTTLMHWAHVQFNFLRCLAKMQMVIWLTFTYFTLLCVSNSRLSLPWPFPVRPSHSPGCSGQVKVSPVFGTTPPGAVPLGALTRILHEHEKCRQWWNEQWITSGYIQYNYDYHIDIIISFRDTEYDNCMDIYCCTCTVVVADPYASNSTAWHTHAEILINFDYRLLLLVSIHTRLILQHRYWL